MERDQLIEFAESLEDWTCSTRKERQAKARKAVAWSYFQYGCFSMVALPLCLPIGEQSMLCNPPTVGNIEYVTGASAGSWVTTLTGNVMVNTDSTGKLYILHRPS